MIISYKNNFIFVKTKKTAGSSMETVLADYCGDDDIVTPLGQMEEIERAQTFPNAYPRNFTTDKAVEKAYREALKTNSPQEVRRAYRDAIRASEDFSVRRHGGAQQAKKLAGDEFWNKAYKFSIERHPYEKVVSLAWWEARRGDFDEQLKSVMEGTRYRNFEIYTIDGKLAVDFVIRFENMKEDIPKAEKAIGGMPILSRLPKSNSKKRADKRPAREVLTDAQKKVVQQVCAEEFEMWGYEK